MKKLLLFPALLMLTAGCGEGIDYDWKCISVTNEWKVYENDSVLLYVPNGKFAKPYIEKKCWCGKEVAE